MKLEFVFYTSYIASFYIKQLLLSSYLPEAQQPHQSRIYSLCDIILSPLPQGRHKAAFSSLYSGKLPESLSSLQFHCYMRYCCQIHEQSLTLLSSFLTISRPHFPVSSKVTQNKNCNGSLFYRSYLQSLMCINTTE